MSTFNNIVIEPHVVPGKGNKEARKEGWKEETKHGSSRNGVNQGRTKGGNARKDEREERKERDGRKGKNMGAQGTEGIKEGRKEGTQTMWGNLRRKAKEGTPGIEKIKEGRGTELQ
jgi:hypothetical protein